MYCRRHNHIFESEQGCVNCRDSWEDGPWETKEKEWLEKLEKIQEKAQKLSNYASGLEVDNKGLKRVIDTMTINLSKGRGDIEKLEATVRRHETKIEAIGLGYRNALEREEKLNKKLISGQTEVEEGAI